MVMGATVILEDGSILKGKIIAFTDETLTIAITEDTVLEIPLAEVRHLDKGDQTYLEVKEHLGGGIVLESVLPLEGSESVNYHEQHQPESPQPDKPVTETTEDTAEQPIAPKDTRTIRLSALKISMMNSLVVEGSFSAPRLDIYEQLFGMGLHVSYWINEFISVFGSLRFSIYDEMRSQGDVGVRFHLTGFNGVYRPYLGFLAGYTPYSHNVTPGNPPYRFNFGVVGSVGGFVGERVTFDFLITSVSFIMDESYDYRYMLGVSLDFLRIGLRFQL